MEANNLLVNLQEKQSRIDNYFFQLLVFTLIFGVMLYDTLGFNYTDEICSLLVLVLYGKYVSETKNWEFNKLFLFTIAIFTFFLFYSFYIGCNTKGAIVTDFIIQFKPYLAFFCVYAMKPTLTKNQKVILKQTIILCCFYLIGFGILNIFIGKFIYTYFGHVSRFATAISILALLYLYVSNYSPKDKLIFILILLVGLFSGRAKFFGFMAFAIFLVIYVNKSFELKFNLKNTLFLIVATTLVILVTKDKIVYYFLQGLTDDGDKQDMFARLALYYYAIPILYDHLIFGTGFATYGTFASAVNYSPVYAKYQLDGIHGLTKADPAFVADTYYPVLVQFGSVGILLFFLFWIYLGVKAVKYFRLGCRQNGIIAILIITFFLIECTTDATITHNRGVFMMMLMGLVYGDMAKEKIKLTSKEESTNG